MTQSAKTPIGTKIKFYRTTMGLSQKRVASKLGIQPATYCKYENNVHKPKEEMIQRIADVIGIDLIELYDERLYNLATQSSNSNENHTEFNLDTLEGSTLLLKQILEPLNYSCYPQKSSSLRGYDITIIGTKGALTLDSEAADEFFLDINRYVNLLVLERLNHQQKQIMKFNKNK